MFITGSFYDIMDGTALRPFQYRVLVPWIAGWLYNMGAVKALFGSLSELFHTMEFVSTFLLIVAFRYYISLFVGDNLLSFILPFSLFFLMPYYFLFPRHDTPITPLMPTLMYDPKFTGFFSYDTPSMMFFTFGLILLYKRKMTPYYLLFVVATLNKETTCFLTIIYLLAYLGKERPRILMLHGTLQFAIWTSIKFMLYTMYRNNPGNILFDTMLKTNLEFLSSPSNYPYIASIWGIWLPVLALRRYIKDDFARRSTYVIVPFFLGMTYVGLLHEVRIFGELIPVFLLAFFLILRELFLKARTC